MKPFLVLLFISSVFLSIPSRASVVNINLGEMFGGRQDPNGGWVGSWTFTPDNSTLFVCQNSQGQVTGWSGNVYFSGSLQTDNCWNGQYYHGGFQATNGEFQFCPVVSSSPPTKNYVEFSGYMTGREGTRRFPINEHRLGDKATNDQCGDFGFTGKASLLGRWVQQNDDVDEFYMSPVGKIFSRYKNYGGGFREVAAFHGGRVLSSNWWDGTGTGMALNILKDPTTMIGAWFTGASPFELNIGKNCTSSDWCETGVVWKKVSDDLACYGKSQDVCQKRSDCYWTSGICMYLQK